MSRAQLAKECGVSLSCVNNWLAESKTNPIPYAKQQLIERIMADREPKSAPDQLPPTVEDMTAIAVMMTKEQRARILAAARKEGLTVEQFILRAATERAERITGTIDQTTSRAC
jgi:hypothetical protein